MSDNKMMDKRHLNILRLFIYDAQAILHEVVSFTVELHGYSSLQSVGRDRPLYLLEQAEKKIAGAIKIIKAEDKRALEHTEKVWAEREKWEAKREAGEQ